MSDKNILPYRKGVGLMILNKDLKVFIGMRIDSKQEAWQMPQGGVDEGENLEEAAFREMEEETGTRNAEIIAQTVNWYSYDLPEYLIPRLWGGKYCGQKQKWFLMKFLGNDSDFDISSSKNAEFMQWRWAKIEDLPNIIIGFKRDLYISVIEEFRDYIIAMKQNAKKH
jgi:putative (di)nucleoside polyphosphate hydrolase